jgi:hypothetical protein
MTLIIQKPTGGKLNLRKGWQPMDPDAAAYITAVETADTEPLEEKTKIAIDNFVLGCKADGTWNAIKASCILAGARTLTGALVPLVGAAPTNAGGLFVSGDYNRKTGLVGNGSTKYLDSGRNNNADPQNNFHLSTYISTAGTQGAVGVYIGNGGPSGGFDGASLIANNTPGNDFFFRARNAQVVGVVATSSQTGFAGVSRPTSSSVITRVSSSSSTVSQSSQPTLASNSFIFARNDNGSLNSPSNGRLAFYSIGESLNLALLDARVTDLINAFAAAIP